MSPRLNISRGDGSVVLESNSTLRHALIAQPIAIECVMDERSCNLEIVHVLSSASRHRKFEKSNTVAVRTSTVLRSLRSSVWTRASGVELSS